MRRDTIVVRYRGEDWERDVAKVRRVLLERRLARQYANVPDFAHKIGCTLSTVYRFLSGSGPGTERTMVRVLEGLGLQFGDVHRKVELAREAEDAR